MPAYADRGYIIAQWKAAKAAGERLLARATKLYGRKRARELLRRAAHKRFQ